MAGGLRQRAVAAVARNAKRHDTSFVEKVGKCLVNLDFPELFGLTVSSVDTSCKILLMYRGMRG